jgi:hypothetical protein
LHIGPKTQGFEAICSIVGLYDGSKATILTNRSLNKGLKKLLGFDLFRE